MPVSMPSVFFCASASSGLCRAAVPIFCWAIWYTCCWLFGLPEKKLPMRLNSPCCSAYTYDWLTLSTAGSSCGFGSVTVTAVRLAFTAMAPLFSVAKSTYAISVPCPMNSVSLPSRNEGIRLLRLVSATTTSDENRRLAAREERGDQAAPFGQVAHDLERAAGRLVAAEVGDRLQDDRLAADGGGFRERVPQLRQQVNRGEHHDQHDHGHDRGHDSAHSRHARHGFSSRFAPSAG